METKQSPPHPQNHPPAPAITLRPFTNSATDFEAVMEFGTDIRVNHSLQFDPFTCRDDAARFIQSFILPHPCFRFICPSTFPDSRPIGSIVLRPEDCGGGQLRRAALGYSVVPEFWGRGIATAAVRMAVAAALREWPELERVQATVFLDNLASQKVLEKVGFSREAVMRRYLVSKGEVRDVVMYGLVVADWEGAGKVFVVLPQ